MKSKFIYIMIVTLMSSFFVIPQNASAESSSPKITSPAYNATVAKSDVKVTWDSVSGAKSYKFSLKNMSKFTQVISDVSVSTTSYTIPSSKLTMDTLYKVSISAILDSSEKMSESYFYVKKLNQLPSFKISTPKDNAILDLSDVNVSWSKAAGATSYTVQLLDVSGMTVINKKSGTTSIRIPKSALKPGHKYRMLIVASASGYSDSRAQLNFSIKGSPTPPRPSFLPSPTKAPTTPSLTSAKITNPKNNSNLQKADITVTWTGDSKTETYLFALRDLDINKMIYNGDLTKTPSFKISASNLTEGHKYRLAVCARAKGYKESWVESYFNIESSEHQSSILSKAKSMCDLTWQPTKNLTGWKANYTFKSGTTYHGIPYSQTEYQIDENGFSSKHSTSDFYSSYKRFNITMPKYGNDCSGFVSLCWGLNRNTTYTFWEGLRDANANYKSLWSKIDQVGKYNVNDPSPSDLKEAYNLLKPGDALLSYKGGHIMLFWKKSGNNFISYEQTPNTSVSEYHYPTCRVTTRDISYFANNHYMPIRLHSN